MNERLESLRQRAVGAGQEHLFHFWESLDEAARGRLLDRVEAIDFELVAALGRGETGEAKEGATAFEPPELFPLERSSAEEARARAAAERGREALAAGRVAYVLVAGGQASRLGYDGPKGAFPVGPLSGRTLFAIHARRLLAATKRYAAPAPWYVMTSPGNDAATRAFFAEHDHFGLEPANVTFFSQEMLPALDDEGKILMASPESPFLAPNGHGGVLLALESSGALSDMRSRGCELVSYFQVDNPLARPVDPLFLGLHAEADAGMSSKVVEKVDPGEKVGVLGRVDGAMGCIEYSDLPAELREAREASGKLRFRAGNIAVHAFSVSFLEGLLSGNLALPWHRARKEMAVIDEDGQAVKRAGTKFETFVFDALSRSSESVTLEVERALEFSPVKNAEGSDSPATARADLCRLHASWVSGRGLPLPASGPEGYPLVEVDPLLAETEEEFHALEAPSAREDGGGHRYEAEGVVLGSGG